MTQAGGALQAVILAGGLGTRLRPITQTVPKAMIPICGRPFLEYQLALLKGHEVRDIVLCVGYRGGAIEEHFGNGSRFGLSIHYVRDGPRQLGTAGALRNAEPYLRDTFFVTYGDGYLRLEYGRVMAFFRRRKTLGLMVTYRNHDRYERNNVAVDRGFVVIYDKTHALACMHHIDFGVAALRKEALALMPTDSPTDLEGFYKVLIAGRQLATYQARRRFYEIGSPDGLAQFEALVRMGRLGAAPAGEAATRLA